MPIVIGCGPSVCGDLSMRLHAAHHLLGIFGSTSLRC